MDKEMKLLSSDLFSEAFKRMLQEKNVPSSKNKRGEFSYILAQHLYDMCEEGSDVLKEICGHMKNILNETSPNISNEKKIKIILENLGLGDVLSYQVNPMETAPRENPRPVILRFPVPKNSPESEQKHFYFVAKFHEEGSDSHNPDTKVTSLWIDPGTADIVHRDGDKNPPDGWIDFLL